MFNRINLLAGRRVNNAALAHGGLSYGNVKDWIATQPKYGARIIEIKPEIIKPDVREPLVNQAPIFHYLLSIGTWRWHRTPKSISFVSLMISAGFKLSATECHAVREFSEHAVNSFSRYSQNLYTFCRWILPVTAEHRVLALRKLIDLFRKLVLPGGIEPTTSPLPRECSTTELRQHSLFIGASLLSQGRTCSFDALKFGLHMPQELAPRNP